jgi:hypothetical protein
MQNIIFCLILPLLLLNDFEPEVSSIRQQQILSQLNFKQYLITLQGFYTIKFVYLTNNNITK